MGKQKNAYTELQDQIRNKIAESARTKGKPSAAVSKSDLESMAHTAINTPDHEVDFYQFSTKDTTGTGEPTVIKKKPFQRYRDSFKPVLQSLGLDKHDVERINDVQFPKEHAAAMMEASGVIIKDYIDAGRKYSFPITKPDECRMEFMTTRAPERVNDGSRFSRNADEDTPVTITKERGILKTKNQVPRWLKETKSK